MSRDVIAQLGWVAGSDSGCGRRPALAATIEKRAGWLRYAAPVLGGILGYGLAEPGQGPKGAIGGAALGALGGAGLRSQGLRTGLHNLVRPISNHPWKTLGGLGVAGGGYAAISNMPKIEGPDWFKAKEPWEKWDDANQRVQGMAAPLQQKHQELLANGDIDGANRVLQQMQSGNYGGGWSLGGWNPWANRPASYYKGQQRAAEEEMQGKYRELMKGRTAQPGDADLTASLQKRLTEGHLPEDSPERAMIQAQLAALKRRAGEVGVETPEASTMNLRMRYRGFAPQLPPRPSSYGGIGGFGNNYGGPLPPMDFIYGGYPRDRRGPGYDMGFMDQSFSPYTR